MLVLGKDGVVGLERVLLKVLGSVLGRHLDVELGESGAVHYTRPGRHKDEARGRQMMRGASCRSVVHSSLWRVRASIPCRTRRALLTRGLPMQTTMGEAILIRLWVVLGVR
jgi:hypothetical protein